MTIVITQTCNGCGLPRELVVGHNNSLQSVQDAAKKGGWRAVQESKHLCANCITEAIKH